MVFSTMNGLIIGTILALTQSFSVNCILPMIVGLCTGIILGATFNLMTTVEGIMGGVMGGLMGAMLGTMLDFSYIYFLALTLLFILGGVTVCLIKLINQEAHTISNVESFPAKNSYLKKLTLGIAFSSLALFSGVLVATSHPVENDIPEVESHEHHLNREQDLTQYWELAPVPFHTGMPFI